MMTPTEINIAVAEASNWQPPPDAMGNVTHGGGRFMSANEWREAHRPNYHGALDAIVPVVRAMPFLERLSVLARLEAIAESPEDALLATPDQWCAAYLDAKGL